MSSHDEYSSDEEDLFDEASNVFLGFTDVAFAEEDDLPTIEDTFIGGQPIWLHPESEPPAQLVECDSCKQKMALLLQAFAPIESKPYDRVIYVFGCKNTGMCSKRKGSVKAIRGVSKDPERIAEVEREEAEVAQKLLDEKLRLDDKKKLHIEMSKDLFDATKPSANPFGGSSANPFGGSSANPFGNHFGLAEAKETAPAATKTDEKKPISYAEVTKKAAPVPAKPSASAKHKLPEYPGYFVFTEQEKFKKVTLEPELEKYKHLLENGDGEDSKKERSMSGSSGTSAGNPQNSQIASMLNDKYFENFSSVVGHNSSQVLRYDLGGKPLLYSGKDDVAKTVASGAFPVPAFNPSSVRQFELQLMPKAIMDLEEQAKKSVADILNGMSWGTIVVATDVEDYVTQLDENHVGYVQEYCGVQWEESV